MWARGQQLDHIGGDHAFVADRLGRELTGPGVHEHGGAGGGKGVDTLGQERSRDSRQHVAGPGRGQRRRAAATDRHPSPGFGDERVITLEDGHGLGDVGGEADRPQATALDLRAVAIRAGGPARPRGG